MGGHAFGSSLSVPRLGPEQYSLLKKQCHTVLLRHYLHVATPPEAPGKSDHGDIDFLVVKSEAPAPEHDESDMLTEFTESTTANTVRHALGAAKKVHNGDTASFAVPWPSSLYSLVEIPAHLEAPSPEQGKHYAQVDIRSVPAALFEWSLFEAAYSDLLQILGMLIRPYGLTATNLGLHVRIAEIETFNRKRSMIFLTSEIHDVLSFFGLSMNRYEAGFQTPEELFEWIATSRFFNAQSFLERRDVKSKDRTRWEKRQMFRNFMDDWAPKRLGLSTTWASQLNSDQSMDQDQFKSTIPLSQDHEEVIEDAITTASSITRESVLQEALTRFGRQELYNQLLAEHHADEREKAFWSEVGAILPLERDNLRLAIRVLKRYVVFVEGQPTIEVTTGLPNESQPLPHDPQRIMNWTQASSLPHLQLREWVLEHWQDLYEREQVKLRAVREEKQSRKTQERSGE